MLNMMISQFVLLLPSIRFSSTSENNYLLIVIKSRCLFFLSFAFVASAVEVK